VAPRHAGAITERLERLRGELGAPEVDTLFAASRDLGWEAARRLALEE
jgi:hypothetical protein